MSARRVPLLMLSIITPLVSGCRDGLGPSDVAGTYVLERVGGAPLPAEVFRDRQSMMQVLADTLRLRDDGTGHYASIRAIHLLGGSLASDIPTRLDSDLQFEIVGTRIDIAFACPENANCIAGPHLVAHQHDGGLIIGTSLVADAPLRYRRVM
jgi:hypothetical protein